MTIKEWIKVKRWVLADQPSNILWHDGWHSFLWLWVSASQRIALSVLVQNPHKELACAISNEPGRRQGKTKSQGSQQKPEKSNSQRKAAAEQGTRICGPKGRVTQHERMSQYSRWLCRNFAQIHTHDSQMHRKPQKSAQTSPFLCLGLTQVRACLFFFLPLSVVYVISCVFVKQCEMSPAGEERNHKMIGWQWTGLRGWDSGDQPVGILSQYPECLYDITPEYVAYDLERLHNKHILPMGCNSFLRQYEIYILQNN